MAKANRSTLPRRHKLFGQVFGKLTAVSYVSRGKWICRCECGNTKTVCASSLVKGNTKSCGCQWHAVSARKTHGLTESAEYKVWCGIKRRCFNQNEKCYPNYGGRGITMCDRWANSFEAFLDDMGKRPSDKHQIDRIDNDGDYAPGNCRWATRKYQCRNRRSSRTITHNGQTRTLAEWQEITGIGWSTIKHRVEHGWPVDLALTTPVIPGNNRRPKTSGS